MFGEKYSCDKRTQFLILTCRSHLKNYQYLLETSPTLKKTGTFCWYKLVILSQIFQKITKLENGHFGFFQQMIYFEFSDNEQIGQFRIFKNAQYRNFSKNVEIGQLRIPKNTS